MRTEPDEKTGKSKRAGFGQASHTKLTEMKEIRKKCKMFLWQRSISSDMILS